MLHVNSMLLMFTPEIITWIKKRPLDCKTHNLKDNYNSLEEAKNACLARPECVAVGDGLCDKRHYYLCTAADGFTSTGVAGSCVYKLSRRNIPGLFNLIRFIHIGRWVH